MGSQSVIRCPVCEVLECLNQTFKVHIRARVYRERQMWQIKPLVTLVKAMWSFITMLFQLSYSIDYLLVKRRRKKKGRMKGGRETKCLIMPPTAACKATRLVKPLHWQTSSYSVVVGSSSGLRKELTSSPNTRKYGSEVQQPGRQLRDWKNVKSENACVTHGSCKKIMITWWNFPS